MSDKSGLLLVQSDVQFGPAIEDTAAMVNIDTGTSVVLDATVIVMRDALGKLFNKSAIELSLGDVFKVSREDWHHWFGAPLGHLRALRLAGPV